jgi:polysaccharide pyruvyl transferase WcaK-like protein
MGVSGPVIVETCDVAVLQPAVSQEVAWSLLERFVPGRESVPLIGISAMKWDYIKAKGKSGYEAYKQAIAVVADEFIEEKGAHVIFIATNVLTEGCREDDVAACGDIVRLMKHQKQTTILNEVYTPSEMEGIMGLFEMALVTRMHACIFSTGIFTPTLSINYQFKLKEYMSLMGLGAYTVDIDVVTVDKLRKLMNQGWENRSVNREILRERVFMWGNQLEREMGRLPEYYNCWKRRGNQ